MLQLWISNRQKDVKMIELSEVPWYAVILYHLAYRWPFYYKYKQITMWYWDLTQENPVNIPITEEIDKSIRINLWKEKLSE